MRSFAMQLVYIASAVAACDRGCAKNDTTLASAVVVKQDCPPGLARCVSGAVEVTEGRATCPGCPCAWKRIEVCERGCAVENVELVRDVHAAHGLCTLAAVATLPPV